MLASGVDLFGHFNILNLAGIDTKLATLTSLDMKFYICHIIKIGHRNIDYIGITVLIVMQNKRIENHKIISQSKTNITIAAS
jgi:hypothetical protein